MIRIRRALLSVSDKTGLGELGEGLSRAGVEILSTGGTARYLRERGIEVIDVSEVTGFPECLGGRVKTLHPKIHAGLLADRDDPAHLEQIGSLEVGLIDLVVVNLYPFEEAARRPGIERKELIEQIDIGGPSMLRSAAKNSDHVVVVCDPADYPRILEGVQGGGVPRETARALAGKVFARTAAYDGAIAARLAGENDPGSWPPFLALPLARERSLRYGENPHQQGALYRPAGEPPRGLAALRQLQGKELSYNNYLDMDAAYRLASAFEVPAAVVVKHLNPCGVGFQDEMEAAYRRALAADPLSAFGGVVACNRPVTGRAAAAMAEIFLEVVIAPSFTPEGREALARKKNLRLVEAEAAGPPGGLDIRSVAGGWLLQTPDGADGDVERKVATARAPSPAESLALERAWIMVRHAKSNAIVIGAEDGMVGLGCGQTSRVDAVRQAAERAERAELPAGARVLASDAFFPFRDGIDAAREAGVTAVIQPGGSVRDEEVIAAADEYDMAMVFTGRRSFRH